MAFEINFTNPMEGPTAFLTGYLNAKKRADAETARLRAQQQQRMADTIGQSIGNVGGALGQGWSRGVADKYRLQDQTQLEDQRAARQAEYQKQRDARQFDYDKQMADYKSNLDNNEEYFKLSGGLTPDEGLRSGREMFKNAPPDVQAKLRTDMGLAPDAELPDDSPVYKHLTVQVNAEEKARRLQEINRARYQDRAMAEEAAKQQAMEQAKFQSWVSEESTVSDPVLQKEYTDTKRNIEKAYNGGKNGTIDKGGYDQAMGNLQRNVLRSKLQPVIPEATNYEELKAGHRPKVGYPYERPDGGTLIYGPKMEGKITYPPKTDAPQVTVQPPPPTPVAAPDGSQWIWDGKTYKEHIPKQTPEQKVQHEQQKLDEAEYQAIAKDAAELQISEVNEDGKSVKRAANPVERTQYIQNRIDAYGMAMRRIQEKRGMGQTQQQAPMQHPEGTIRELDNGSREILRGGQWVPVNGR
jgi:hypothetical protein